MCEHCQRGAGELERSVMVAMLREVAGPVREDLAARGVCADTLTDRELIELCGAIACDRCPIDEGCPTLDRLEAMKRAAADAVTQAVAAKLGMRMS